MEFADKCDYIVVNDIFSVAVEYGRKQCQGCQGGSVCLRRCDGLLWSGMQVDPVVSRSEPGRNLLRAGDMTGGRAALDEFTELRTFTVATGPLQYPF